MPPLKRRNYLRDVNVAKIDFVPQGANNKRFFMRKAAAAEPFATVQPESKLILKAGGEDWTAVYCVVAEPGWEEGAGIGEGADQAVPDVWLSEDEIRKACHRFAKNGGLISAMHATADSFGTLVENTIAQEDFTLQTPDGTSETIKKGSWYIAVEPNAEGRAAIEKGEWGGVSIEGEGIRVMVEKSEAPAVGRDTLDGVKPSFLRKLAQAVGMPEEEIEASFAKTRTFGEVIAQRELDDELPDAMDALRSCIWMAYYPDPDDDTDPETLIRQSLKEFEAWALDLLGTVSITKGDDASELKTELAKKLGVPDDAAGSVSQEMTLTKEEREEFDGLKKSVDELPARLTDIVKSAVEEATKEEPEAPTLEAVTDELGTLGESLKKVAADVKKLGAGGSTQPAPEERSTVVKSDGAGRGVGIA